MTEDNEAIAAARMVLHGPQPEPSHVMYIGWPTIKRLMAGDTVWLETEQCGAMGAADLLDPQQSLFAMELIVAELQKQLRRAQHEREIHMSRR